MKSINVDQKELLEALATILYPSDSSDIPEPVTVKFLFEHLKIVLDLNEKDFYKAVHLFFALADTDEYIKRIVDVLSIKSPKSLHQLQLLAYLYNSTGKSLVFVALVKSASSFNMMDRLSHLINEPALLQPHLSKLSDQDAKTVMDLLAKYDTLKFGPLLIKQYCNGPNDSARVLECIGRLLKLNWLKFQDLVTCPSVKSNTVLSDFLKMLLAGDISKFSEFASKNAAIFEKMQISSEECLQKVRVVALVRFGSDKIGQSVTYKQVSTHLKLQESEVERLVIDAVRCQLLEAKINQMTMEVFIGKCVIMEWTPAQWKWLSQKLELLVGNFSNTDELIRQAHDLSLAKNTTIANGH